MEEKFMAVFINLPKLGLTMTKGTIIRWLKNEGDFVKKGDVLVEFETDKINTEYESPEEGYLLKILAQENEEVEVSAPICIIGRHGENLV
jgi:pyruvate/2-oxoglutarate dehydrogenase complex dihydrolipoamide acyltransferase (E2) component